MNEDSEFWNSAREQLNELCVKVGLDQTPELPSPGIMISAPAGTTLWSSSYALVLLWPCSGSDHISIERAAAQGQAWFDEVLVRNERLSPGSPIDGYLVLAIPEAPEAYAREEIRRLELSAQVCRKHMIWPSSPVDYNYEPGLWQRVADITVLGLPDSAAPSGNELQWPELDSEAQALWAELSTLGVNGTILRHEGPLNARN
ncbi:hypothetical protein [Pseudomonas sp. NA-150]|uniref:hypothetical protein n=1 Tax=Pseudomonas sp. NA-150 TaxID=3367525 RepID=UPI0037CB98D2